MNNYLKQIKNRIQRLIWIMHRLLFFLKQGRLFFEIRERLFKKSYQTWLKNNDIAVNSPGSMNGDICFSIILPTYNTPAKWLRLCLDSVLKQSYSNWELCIADDCSTERHVSTILKKYAAKDARIKVVFREKNGHISEASNSALALATGDFIALLDHDDELHPEALTSVFNAIKENPQWKIIYTDEDKISAKGKRSSPYFKPDWNPELFFGQNFFCHLGIYSRNLINLIGGFRVGYEGSQDWDLVLRCMERITSSEIGHIRKILYHWRIIPGSTASDPGEKKYCVSASEKALFDYFSRNNIDAKTISLKSLPGNNQFKRDYNDNSKISIIIPTKDRVDLLKPCIDSIIEKTTYQNYEIIIADNQTTCLETLKYFHSLKNNTKITISNHDYAFNYSKINNDAVKNYATGDIVLLLNNDTEVITPHWLEEMVSHAIQPDIGAVGAKLYFTNNTIQHVGVNLLGNKIAGHPYSGFQRNFPGQLGRCFLTQELSAVTGACLMVKKSIYESAGGLDESLKVAYNDIDFCVKLREMGFRNIWTPFAELYHHESQSRGYEVTKEKQERFQSEIDLMNKKWGEKLEHDPFYSKFYQI